MKKPTPKNLLLSTERVRELTTAELKQIDGGKPCPKSVAPSGPQP